MSLLESFTKSLSYQWEAITFMFRNHLAWTLLIPIIFFILLLIGGFASITTIANYCTNTFGAEYSPLFFTAGSIILHILFFIILGVWGGYIIVILLSPFMAYVSEKTEKILTGKDYPFDCIQFIKDIIRGILLAMRNCFMELLICFLIFIGAFIPFIGPICASTIGTIFLFCVSAYYYGFSFIDYTLERRKLSVSQSVNYVKLRKGTAVGHGFIFALLMYIPLIGIMISSFFAITSTIAATIELVEENKATQMNGFINI